MAQERTTGQAAAGRERRPTYKVLLVEDSPGDARLVIEMLHDAEDARFDLARATRLEEALRRIGRGGIDVVLLDVLLPDSMGVDTFRRLRDHAPDLPVIVLTGLGDEEVSDKLMAEGAQECLLKGRFDGADLTHTILKALRRHEARGAVDEDRLWRLGRSAYRQVLDAVGEGVVVIDPKGVVHLANKPAQGLYGYEEGDVAGALLELMRDGATDGDGVQADIDGHAVRVHGRRTEVEGHDAFVVTIHDNEGA